MAVSRVWVGSPNFTPGRSGYRPRAVVIHIMQGTIAATDSWFRSTRSQVSAHFGVAVDGRVHQYVEEGDTAWHAGRVSSPVWPLLKKRVNPNLYTIGIEHEGWSGEAWSEAMLASSASLIAELATRWVIPLDRRHVVRHSEIYALKPFCPGTGVDLDDLVRRATLHMTAASSFNFVARAGRTTATSGVNVRRQAPVTSAPLVQRLSRGDVIEYVGWTSNGENVHGNPHWYRIAHGNYIWAGATSDPVPGAGTEVLRADASDASPS